MGRDYENVDVDKGGGISETALTTKSRWRCSRMGPCTMEIALPFMEVTLHDE